MLSSDTMQHFIDSLPWPANTKPVLKAMVTGRGFAVLLCEPISRGWTDIAQVEALTSERALAAALEAWILAKKLNDQPAFWTALKRLSN
jgi:hypothetical protein